MITFSSQRDFTNALAEQIKRVHSGYAGAHFRVAFARVPPLRLLTASVLFGSSYVPSRKAQDYGTVLLVEEWVQGEAEALERLAQLLSGQGAIGTQRVTEKFSRTDGDRQTYVGVHHWTGWRYVSRLDPDPLPRNYYLPTTSLLAHGLRPFLGAAEAVIQWVSAKPSTTTNQRASAVPDQDCIVTMLPDTRAEIISAEWLPGLLRMRLRCGVPLNELEFQLIYEGATREFDVIQVSALEMDIEVPGGRQLSIYLMHVSNECVANLMFTAPYSSYGETATVLSGTQQAITDLANGENDTVEYKPFVEPRHAKESELVETVIAFANTRGGRLYVGVADDGVPQGEAELRKLFRADLDSAAKAQEDRLRLLIRERIKPVPDVSVKQAIIHGEPVVVVDVKPGGRRPYATHENKAFVRKGATNKLADPHAEWAGLLAPHTVF